MSDVIYLMKKSDLAPGQVRKVDANGCPVAVYNLDGVFYATHDICTHATASLSEGEIVDDDCIACPVHNGTFHIPSGQAMDFPCEVAVRTYKVFEQGEDVMVDLKQEAEEAAGGI